MCFEAKHINYVSKQQERYCYGDDYEGKTFLRSATSKSAFLMTLYTATLNSIEKTGTPCLWMK
jgi:hypothetical protein